MTGNHGRLHPGSSLVGFDEVARERLDGMLATYGFLVEMSKEEAGFAMRRFRNGQRYITVEAAAQKGQYPVGRVKLGTGSADWPEGDWNQIPLGRLIEEKRPDRSAADYPLDNLTLASFLDTAAKDLQDYAMDFIAGELFAFKRLRAEAAKQKPAYELFGSGPYSENTLEYMRVSKLLKEKYSSEAAA
ncbi:MAG TPA: hypothetical protein VHE55_18620 [Fimbriimonadaceae bacterium]|nr:hypothetical protein [Fimbriimonadaceae bacterium]